MSFHLEKRTVKSILRNPNKEIERADFCSLFLEISEKDFTFTI